MTANSFTPVLATATSQAAGAISVGGTKARSTVGGQTHADLLGNVAQATSVTVAAMRDVDARATAEAPATGLLLGVAGADAGTSAVPSLRAIVGGDITASGDVAIRTESLGKATATATGTAGGFLGFGNADATALLRTEIN